MAAYRHRASPSPSYGGLCVSLKRRVGHSSAETILPKRLDLEYIIGFSTGVLQPEKRDRQMRSLTVFMVIVGIWPLDRFKSLKSEAFCLPKLSRTQPGDAIDKSRTGDQGLTKVER